MFVVVILFIFYDEPPHRSDGSLLLQYALQRAVRLWLLLLLLLRLLFLLLCGRPLGLGLGLLGLSAGVVAHVDACPAHLGVVGPVDLELVRGEHAGRGVAGAAAVAGERAELGVLRAHVVAHLQLVSGTFNYSKTSFPS